MNFDYSDDEKAMKDQVRRVLDDRDAKAIRRVFDGEQPFDAAMWRQAIELGWTGVAIGENVGGLGLGHVMLCGVAEELGRVLAPIPFASSIFMAAEAIAAAGTDAQKARYLPPLADGTELGTFAFAEDRVVASFAPVRVEGGLLHGRKVAVADGMAADLAVVSAAGDLFVVRLDQPGVSRDVQAGIDPSRPIAALRLDGAKAERLNGWQGDRTALDRTLDRAAVLTAFEQLGGAQAALELARSYAMERIAFGRPIGSFQAIKHILAEAYVAIELARSLAYYGAWALATDAPDLPVAAASARLAATAAFEQAARDLIQTHGGIGMTWEHDAHLYYRRSRHLALLLGDRGEWRERLMTQVVGRRIETHSMGSSSNGL